jgi:hypothetical protein
MPLPRASPSGEENPIFIVLDRSVRVRGLTGGAFSRHRIALPDKRSARSIPRARRVP